MLGMNGLYSKVAGDPVLQQKFSQIMADAELYGQTGDPSVQTATEEKLQAFAKEAGYDISIQEMKDFFQGMATQTEGELSDMELDQVAGGKVQADKVVNSVFSAGIVCAIASIIYATRSKCDDYFHEESTYEGY